MTQYYRFLALGVSSFNGILYWHIKEPKQRVVYSPPFYAYGYKLCLVASSIQNSIAIALLKGGMDNDLAWPMGNTSLLGIHSIIYVDEFKLLNVSQYLSPDHPEFKQPVDIISRPVDIITGETILTLFEQWQKVDVIINVNIKI